METRDDLLQASLGHHDSPATSIYSARTGYLASFFGGPLAGGIIAVANAYRLRRLKTDWPLGVLAIAAAIGPSWWWIRGGSQWTVAHVGEGVGRIVFRALGLAFFALVYGWHRQFYRNMTFFGLSPPSGWLIGIVAIVASLLVEVAVEALY